MALFLGLVIFAIIITALAVVPFIDFLYRLQLTRPPVGGGVLITLVVTGLFAFIYPTLGGLGVFLTSSYQLHQELNVIFFTFISFALFGLYDDILITFKIRHRRLPVNLRYLIQLGLAIIVAVLLYFNLDIDIVNIPFLGVWRLGWAYIPLAVGIIMFFVTAFGLTDQVDGLSCGTLLICLLAFWALSVAALDTPLTTFVALWIGSLLAVLYFNVYPARIRLGKAGRLAFGATLAVVGLLLGKVVALVVIGGVFSLELGSALLQISWQKLTGRKLFSAPVLHLYLQQIGWSVPKIAMRGWLAAIMFALFGIWLALL